MFGTAKKVHPYPPSEVVELLRSADANPGNPRLARVLECFRRRWVAWAQLRYPNCEAWHEDAVRKAQVDVLKGIVRLRDPVHVDRWADNVFAIVLREIEKEHGPRARRVSGAHRIPEVISTPPRHIPRPTGPLIGEDRAMVRGLLETVRSVVSVCEKAWPEFERLLTKEIKGRNDLSQSALVSVVELLLRVCRVLQRMLDETDEE